MSTSCQGPEVTLAPSPRGADLQLAARCGVPSAAARDAAAWQIVRSGLVLVLEAPAESGLGSLAIDLLQGPLARRLRGSRRDEPLPRAIGLARKGAPPPMVLDATAGLCRDVMVLATLGCRVLAVERIPALAMLAAAAVADSDLGTRLTVVAGDALTWLAEHGAAAAPDVVYLDPMFAGEGSAQVKKDMQFLRALAGPADDPGPLLAAARQVALERVVVKRHPDEPPLAPAAFAVAGERVRFDVYLSAPNPTTPAP